MKLLVVDDDRAVLAALSDIVASWGGEAHCVENGAEAALLLSRNRYEFVLLDLRMPIRNGVWFMENAMIPSHTKVILMSAYVPLGVMQRMRELGITDYLEKPFTPDELLDLLQRHSQGHIHTAAA